MKVNKIFFLKFISFISCCFLIIEQQTCKIHWIVYGYFAITFYFTFYDDRFKRLRHPNEKLQWQMVLMLLASITLQSQNLIITVTVTLTDPYRSFSSWWNSEKKKQGQKLSIRT